MQYQSNSSTVRLKRRDVLIETYGGHLDMKYLDINFLRLCSTFSPPLLVSIPFENGDVSRESELTTSSEILNMKERNTGTLVQSETRSSVQAFIDEMIYLDLAALPLIVEKITGLHSVKATSSEHLQVASYTPGGHFNAHVDAVSAVST
ncbi:unnamed protein product [Allacma fusca]|uniref:Uncharacterized protein n=1 Tax=Allacma fusca TaxID=39272 RepID=A0A8J2MAY2_9HEXA|nr:unnamed protein product [Allacma fusca]